MSEPVTLALVSYNKADVVGLALSSVARGSRRPDLVVLSDNPMTVPEDQLDDLQVLQTIKEGETVYHADSGTAGAK